MDLQKNTPSLQKNHPTSIEFRKIMYRRSPLPEPGDFGKYEKILPGAANRILTMAELQQHKSIGQENLNWLAKFIGIILARVFLYFLVIVAFILVIKGKEAAAFITALAPIISIFVSTFKYDEPRQ